MNAVGLSSLNTPEKPLQEILAMRAKAMVNWRMIIFMGFLFLAFFAPPSLSGEGGWGDEGDFGVKHLFLRKKAMCEVNNVFF